MSKHTAMNVIWAISFLWWVDEFGHELRAHSHISANIGTFFMIHGALESAERALSNRQGRYIRSLGLLACAQCFVLRKGGFDATRRERGERRERE